MSRRPIRSRILLAAAAVACSTAVAVAPMSAFAAGGAHAAKVGRYDHKMLSKVNVARFDDSRHSYRMNAKVRRVALRWAHHLATTGTLAHNPNLFAAISKACPHWSSIGENVGFEGGANPAKLFSAYMHSPPHRANILRKSYTVVGIATVTVKKNGSTTEWNVMDFANHCGK